LKPEVAEWGALLPKGGRKGGKNAAGSLGEGGIVDGRIKKTGWVFEGKQLEGFLV